MTSFKQIIVRTPVHCYRFLVSPFLAPRCRFYPTCSSYMLEAMESHGILKGFLLGIRRILKCHPWHKADFNDPVPKQFTWRLFMGYKRSIRNIKK
ncbi:MAG: membrane protein insertion efficiency factor YidD [Alphaproteobacteria bacterium CG_4_9_14_3_um_filter_47_13]|nr:MAG: membrane protein insertion efficiency factor YidD [Alphaproteobacteria bacterium CG_4_9_14_3_um_filter_47_13]